MSDERHWPMSDTEVNPTPPPVTECPQVRTAFRSAREDYGVVRRARVIVAITLPDDGTEVEVSVNGERLFMSNGEC
jgi:hypothetical protein